MKESVNSGFFAQVLKAVAAAFIFTLALILIFALILKSANMSSLAVKTVNQFIKAISLFAGCFLFLKEGKGLIKGALVGVLWAALVYASFALFGKGEFTALAIVADFIFAMVIGGLSGVIAVNMRSK